MFRKKTRRLMVFLCTAMLVWSQLALSAYACPLDLLAAPAMEADMPADCAAEMKPQATPLCKAHCEQSPQSNQTPSLDIPPLALVSLAVVLPADMPAPSAAIAGHVRPLWLADASPPLRIRYQVFRN